MDYKPKDDETLTPFIRGKIKVIQSKTGYRFNIDSVLLAGFVNISNKKSKLLDLGTGSGILILLLSLKYKNLSFYGVELQENLFSQAWRNLKINNINGQLFKGDIREIKKIFKRESIDYVVFNPPYHKPQPDTKHTEKNIARFELESNIKDFIYAAEYVLKPNGKLFFIFPSTRLSEIILILLEKKIQPKRYRFVYPSLNENSSHVLIEAVKYGNPSGEIIEKPLVVYDKPDKKIYSPEVNFLLEKFYDEGANNA